jgi:hypothetical protein
MLADGDEEIADAIVLLLGNPQRRAELASAARLWASARFARRRTIQAYEGVYVRACANHAADAVPSEPAQGMSLRF